MVMAVERSLVFDVSIGDMPMSLLAEIAGARLRVRRGFLRVGMTLQWNIAHHPNRWEAFRAELRLAAGAAAKGRWSG